MARQRLQTSWHGTLASWRWTPVVTVALVLTFAAGCQGDGPDFRSTGVATPTVAGGPEPSYANYDEARLAFTRTGTDGVLTATLEDAAWIRFEGDPEGALQRHRSYFDGVATVFEVVFRPKDYVRIPEEVFILEDSAGRRMTAKPKRYEGEMKLVDDRFHFTFDLKFAHAVTAELKWLRLTHESSRESIEWTFNQASGTPAPRTALPAPEPTPEFAPPPPAPQPVDPMRPLPVPAAPPRTTQPGLGVPPAGPAPLPLPVMRGVRGSG